MSTTHGIINPATEEEIATVAVHDLDETNRAIERASAAAPVVEERHARRSCAPPASIR